VRRLLPEGALAVAVGLGISGVSTYVFFAIAHRALSEHDYSDFGVLWTALFAVGNGIMQPLEQEVARAVSDRRERGIGPAPVIRRAVTIGAAFSIIVVVVSLLARSAAPDRWFGGSAALTLAFVLGLCGFCAGHLTRGVLSSHRRFRAYARFFGFDGISRVAMAAVLVLVGVTSAGPFGFAMAAALFVGVAAALIGQKGLSEPGPEAPWSELTTKLGWLLLGTGSISLLVQGGTLAVDFLATPEQSAAAGVMLNGLTTARIPLFVFQAILASLLPKLSRLAAIGQFDEFVASLRGLVGTILGFGVVTTAVAGLLGPTVISFVYGTSKGAAVPTASLSGRDLALLAAAFILIMATICLDQALIALNGHSRMAIGWLVALATFVGVTVVSSSDLYLRVELGLLAASVLAFVWMSAFLAERLRHHAEMRAVDHAEALAELQN
jgi:O-antigen/teichoic acid export membrane protein